MTMALVRSRLQIFSPDPVPVRKDAPLKTITSKFPTMLSPQSRSVRHRYSQTAMRGLGAQKPGRGRREASPLPRGRRQASRHGRFTSRASSEGEECEVAKLPAPGIGVPYPTSSTSPSSPSRASGVSLLLLSVYGFWGTDTPKRPKHTHTTLAQAHEACGSIPGSSARAHVETDPAQDWGGGGRGGGRLCCSSSLQTSRELQKLSGCPRFGGSLGIFSLPLSAVCCVFPPTFSWVREQPRASYLCARGAFLPTEASKVSLFCFVEGERFEQEPHESSS